MIDKIEELLNMENPTTRLNWRGCDKGDCSKVGIVRILLDYDGLKAISDKKHKDWCDKFNSL